MDAERILQLRERTEEMRDMERRVHMAKEEKQRKELEKTLKNLRRQVQTLQRNVLSTYNGDFITCRDIGHRWTLKESSIDSNELLRTLICDCGTVRHEAFSRFGEMLHRSYTHPDDYLLPSQVVGTQRYTKEFWRGITFMATAADR